MFHFIFIFFILHLPLIESQPFIEGKALLKERLYCRKGPHGKCLSKLSVMYKLSALSALSVLSALSALSALCALSALSALSTF